MGLLLKQSTAVDVIIGVFVDDADGKTVEAALTIEDANVLLSKLGQGLTAKNDANDAAYDANGFYNCPLNATDTNTLGTLQLSCNMAGALPVYHEFMVVTANVWDTLCAADKLDVNLVADQSAATVGTVSTVTSCTTTVTNTDLTAFAVNYSAARAGYIDELAAANIPTDLTNIANAVDAVDNFVDTEITAIVNAIAALNNIAAADVLAEAVDGAVTLKQALAVILAFSAGKCNGGGTATINFRDIGDTKNRIQATVTAVGDRTAVTRDGA